MSAVKKDKLNKPKLLSAIFDDIREMNCDFCHNLERSELPEQLAAAAKEVDEREVLLLYQLNKGTSHEITVARDALRNAKVSQSKLNKRLLIFMLKSNEKLFKIMINFREFSIEVIKGDYTAG